MSALAALPLLLLSAVGLPATAVPQQATSEPAPAQASTQTVVEVRVHGNYETSDEEVLAIAGIAIGDRVDDAVLDAAVKRLEDSGRFADVEVLRRYRSLTSFDEVVLILQLRERKSVAQKFLFLPEIHYNEDEKFSVGARVSTKSLLGGGEMLSIPVTFGGVDRVALEARRDWERWSVGATVEARRFENPYYDIDDERVRGSAFVERELLRPLRLRAYGSYQQVDFGETRDHLGIYGLRLAFDTRPNATFPYDAVLARVGWERVAVVGSPGVNRFRVELAGYKTLFGPVVLAARALFEDTDAALPLYERPYVGGMNSLRGTRAGTYSGDGQALGTVEVRIPLTTMSGIGRAGFTVFYDLAGVWENVDGPGSAVFHQGVGGGVFLQVPIVQLNLDVGNDTQGSTRVHFGLGFRF